MARKFSYMTPDVASIAPPGPLPERPSLGEEIYDILLSQLISLKIPPGEKLSIDALARDLRVSQTPIRSALIRLEAEGLVMRKHNAGYSAAPIPSGDRFRQLYDFRLLLEPAATAMATRNMDATQRAALAETGLEMAESIGEDSEAGYGRFAILDARFHDMITESCGNELIIDALGRLHVHMHLFRLRYHSTVTEQAVKEHSAILEKMEAGDADGAAAAMRTHIECSQARMEPFYKFLK